MTNKITLPRHNLAHAVVNQLQQQISLGQYQPGEKLPSEPELMEQLGVGRSTIREAIRILANTGIVSVRQGSGTFVEAQEGIEESLQQRIRRTNSENLDEVRKLLEMKIAEKAAIYRSQACIDKMQSALVRRNLAADAGEIAGCIRADIEFHTAIATACGNDILADLYRTIAHQMGKNFLETHQDTSIFKRSQHLHESLLKSIIEQDPAQAWHWASEIVNDTDKGINQ